MSTTLHLLDRAARPESVASDALHPWLHALDVFDIPFLCYASDGGRCRTSGAAEALIAASPVGEVMAAQADRIAGDDVPCAPPLQLGQFALMRSVPTQDGWSLALYQARPAVSGIAAVVVVRPHAIGVSPRAELCGLSARELQVARLVAGGLVTKAIAGRLGISPHTARHHVERVFAKLGVHSRAAVAALVGAQGRCID